MLVHITLLPGAAVAHPLATVAELAGTSGLAGLAVIGDDGSGSAEPASSPADRSNGHRRAVSDGGLTVRSFSTELAEFEGGAGAVSETPQGMSGGDGRPDVVASLESTLADLDSVALDLLRLYRTEGPEMPADAYHAVTGRQDRVAAYGANRRLRTAGLVEHVGRGHYDYCLETRVAAGLSEDRDEGMASVYARDLEQQFLD